VSRTLPDISGSWVWTVLGAIADIKLGKMLSPKAYAANLIQRPYLRNENVRWGHIDFSDVKYMGFSGREIDRYSVAVNDLLVCEGGEPGRCAVYKGGIDGLMYQKALHRVRPYDDLVDVKYIQAFLQYAISSTDIIERPSETTMVPPQKPQNRRLLAQKSLDKLSVA
jgi:type I restriction enzyme S subunit